MAYKIYRVSLPQGLDLGYDSYSEFTMIADCEATARNTHPGQERRFDDFYPRSDGTTGRDWVQPNQLHLLVVEELGLANPENQHEKVLTKSFTRAEKMKKLFLENLKKFPF